MNLAELANIHKLCASCKSLYDLQYFVVYNWQCARHPEQQSGRDASVSVAGLAVCEFEGVPECARKLVAEFPVPLRYESGHTAKPVPSMALTDR